MGSTLRACLIAASMLALATASAFPQPADIPEPGTRIESMGLPQKYKFHAGATTNWERRGDGALGAEVTAGTSASRSDRALTHPAQSASVTLAQQT